MRGRRDLELHSLLLAADERAGVMADQLAESIHYAVAVVIVERLCAGESADSVASEYAGAAAFVGGADEAIRELRAGLARVAPGSESGGSAGNVTRADGLATLQSASPDSTPPAGQSTAVESRPGSVDAAGGTSMAGQSEPQAIAGAATQSGSPATPASEPSEPVSDEMRPCPRCGRPGCTCTDEELKDALRWALDDCDKFKGRWENVGIVCDKQHVHIATLTRERASSRARIAELENALNASDGYDYCRDQIATITRERDEAIARAEKAEAEVKRLREGQLEYARKIKSQGMHIGRLCKERDRLQERVTKASAAMRGEGPERP